ncbi:hypothetical protein [Halomonas garicola]|nr:hypothetical protein [Halomonas garicola]
MADYKPGDLREEMNKIYDNFQEKVIQEGKEPVKGTKDTFKCLGKYIHA